MNTIETVYGMVRTVTDDFTHHWTVTTNPDDMLRSEDEFVPLTDTKPDTIRAAMDARYPRSDGFNESYVLTNPYDKPNVTACTLPVVNASGRVVVRTAVEATRRVGGPVLVRTPYRATEVLRDAYKEPDYDTAPVVLTAVGPYLLSARPDPKAAKVRTARRSAALERQKVRDAEKRVETAKQREINRRRDLVSSFQRDVKRAAEAVLDEVIRRTVGSVSYLTDVHVRLKPDEIDPTDPHRTTRTRTPVAALLAAAVIYRRLTPRGSDWTVLTEVVKAVEAYAVLVKEKLWADPKFDPVHPDDVVHTKRFARIARKLLKRAADASAVQGSPS